MNKNNVIVALAVVLTLGIISGSLLLNDRFIFTSAKTDNIKTVILDAGHGGFDGGAVAHDGTVEKDINLKISSFLKEAHFPCPTNLPDSIFTQKATDLSDKLL